MTTESRQAGPRSSYSQGAPLVRCGARGHLAAGWDPTWVPGLSPGLGWRGSSWCSAALEASGMQLGEAPVASPGRGSLWLPLGFQRRGAGTAGLAPSGSTLPR